MTSPIRDALQKAQAQSPRIQAHLDEIEEAMANGMTQTEILNVLSQHGVNATLTGLRSAISRHRQRKKSKNLYTRNQKRDIDSPTASEEASVKKQEEEPVEGMATPTPPETKESSSPNQNPDPWAYKNPLTEEQRQLLKTMMPHEKIAFFREQAQNKKFRHNPTPERFRKEGEE